jgi:hypothetical protein
MALHCSEIPYRTEAPINPLNRVYRSTNITCTMNEHHEDRIENLTTKLQRDQQVLKVIERGLVVSGMMPIDEWLQILPVIILLAVPPVWPNGSNPVHFCVRSACEGSVSLPAKLSFQGSNSGLPMLGVFGFHNKNSSQGEGRCTTSMMKSGM